MSNQRKEARRQSRMVAFCGLMAALSTVIMLLGGLIPIAVYVVPMFCGALLLPVMLEFGKKAAWATFLVTAALALILGFDKEAAFFYLFTGYYPIVRWRFDRIKARPLRILAKLLLFTLSIALMYGCLYLLFPLHAAFGEFREMGIWLTILSLVIFDVSMLIYDVLLVRLILIYANRIKPKLRFLH